MPLGLMEGSVCTRRGPLPIGPGGLLLLLSDGFPEAHSPEGGPFGLPGVLDYVREHYQHSAKSIVDGLVCVVRQHCHPAAPHDDMTAVVVKSAG
jgi:serine phosphatase RsbU (regulator of sigma subunit)